MAQYHGSQWWALSDAAVQKFLSVYHADEDLRTSFEYSAVPDEHYIQTALRHSDLAPKITGSPMLADFSKHPTPYVYTNATELDQPKKTTKLFARKCPSDCSSLIEAIRPHPRFTF
ncbi:beta-1,6-N-acetylglucosaminyltransferase [Microvirga sp. VF16]|uniref:beta-1,6-N-acetylglucosaminyltransferase n=1 Tax=Microvirga sp. VF16 TaxID=2807101 RepID=UPI00193DD437|nr:hypothetical protein JO965_43035 [Microvirga sp. VF16]